MRFQPRPYQGRFIDRLRADPRVAGFLDMGLGKTVCVLSTILALRVRALVVAPKRVCESTWPDEAQAWDHTKGMHLQVIQRRSIAADVCAPADVHLVSYDNLVHLWRMLADAPWPWQLIVFDESSRMKAPTSQRMRATRKVLHHFPRRVILSGTPAAEGYADLWSQVYLLDDGKRLGAYITHFRSNYLEKADWMGYSYKLKPGAAKRIRRKIADLVVCLRSEDYLTLPAIIRTDHYVNLPGKIVARYRQLERDLLTSIARVDVEAINAAALSIKCRQLASGEVYGSGQEIAAAHGAKLTMLQELIESAQSPVIVCYQFRHEAKRLLDALPGAVLLKHHTAVVLRRWNAGRVRVLLAHPASCGHGLNLQAGGHTLVWYSLPWSGEQYEQMEKRLHRSGQAHPVLVHRILARRTVDEAMILKLAGKLGGQAGMLAALRTYAKARPAGGGKGDARG